MCAGCRSDIRAFLQRLIMIDEDIDLLVSLRWRLRRRASDLFAAGWVSYIFK